MYVKYEERRTALLKAGVHHIIANSPSKDFRYFASGSSGSSSMGSRTNSIVSEEGSIVMRYSDGSGRPLLARPPVPTVLWAQQQGPIMEESESEFPTPYSTMPMKRFTTFNPSPDRSPPRPIAAGPEKPTRASYHEASSNVFCKADVHFEHS